MPKIEVYTTKQCTYCNAAKALLQRNGLDYTEISLDQDPEKRRQLSAENRGYRTVPMIFINDTFIGGYDELRTLDLKALK